MNKIWIKLLRAYDGKAAGELIEIDEPIARALIKGEIAEESKAAEDSLVSTVISEVTGKFNQLSTELNQKIDRNFKALADGIKPLSSGHIEVVEDEDDKKFRSGGFRSIGHFAKAVFRGMHPSEPDQDYKQQIDDWKSVAARVTRGVLLNNPDRQIRAQASGLSEAVDPEGGLLVPSDHAVGIWERSREYPNLTTRFPMYPIAGNSMVWNADAETSRANGSRRGGVLSYWAAEAGQYTKSKPTFRQLELKLKKLTVLVYATNELLEDSGGALEAYVGRVAPEEIAFRLNDAAINGPGAGIPLGLLNSDAKITVAAVSGQGANTITATNVDSMWARRYAAAESNYVWLYNQAIEPQLQRMYYATGSNSGQLVYMPAGGISGTRYPTLKGREMINCEQCSDLGTEGDLILANFNDHIGIMKSTGPQQTVSIHLRFDYDETVFKFGTRVDFQTAWVAPLTPFKGSNTQGPIVTLNSSRT